MMSPVEHRTEREKNDNEHPGRVISESKAVRTLGKESLVLAVVDEEAFVRSFAVRRSFQARTPFVGSEFDRLTLDDQLRTERRALVLRMIDVDHHQITFRNLRDRITRVDRYVTSNVQIFRLT